MSNKTLVISAVSLALGLILLGRFSGGSPAGTSAVKEGNHSGTSVIQGQQAPDITLNKLGGGKISLADYKDKKPVIIDFWASWCPNCRRDMPVMNGLYNTYKDQVEMIGINLQERAQTAQKYVSQAGITFPIALDQFGSVSKQFGIQYTNTHILINTDGSIFRFLPGDLSEQAVQDLIAAQ